MAKATKTMTGTKPTMKMPELTVFARSLVTGFVGAEVGRSAFYLGSSFAKTTSEVALWLKVAGILPVVLLCFTYAAKRDVYAIAGRMARSVRFDLLLAVSMGIWANGLASPLLAKAHATLKDGNPSWAPAVLILLCAVLLSPLLPRSWSRRKTAPAQRYFIADEEIEHESDDLLANHSQAKSFAQAVLESGAHPGLVFGVEGPWGVGKTSFINLAARIWTSAEDRVIVCRFEPLRYASEPDLADRLIRDVSAAIQRKVFAPEFRPAASRYSRLIKGKADVSFLGFKLSLEPSQETVDDLLDEIDEVLKRIERRVIVVIDDLDRLDAKTINNVLFATRRTFKLTQATYILCYDTELLTAGKEEGSRAREFLEKFVTVKLSLFIDSSSIRDFLRRDWQRAENQLGSIPSDTMLKLSAVLSELASILDSALAAEYLPLVGDLRKVKRFVNAMLLMQIEKSDLGRTDFNKRDLINLMLLHLNYPGLFRRIYAEETEGRSGSFSVRRDFGEREFKNASNFSGIVKEQQEPAAFLLKQLFNVEALGLQGVAHIDEAVLASRACFNQDSSRNLEKYLKLIVRFATPEPSETFVLYKDAVDRVKSGEAIASVLAPPDFGSQHAHDQFWRLLINQSNELVNAVANDAIDTLVDNLPSYSAITNDDRGLRQVSIYSLLRLLDRAGWGATSGRRHSDKAEDTIEIAWRIFGEHSYEGKGLLKRLVSSDRGVLGWNDLMLFRLQCCADRQGQLYNVYSALILHQDRNAATTSSVSVLLEMRELSQRVFALFKRTYLDSGRNFFAEVSEAPASVFFGAAPNASNESQSQEGAGLLDQRVARARTLIKSFVIYQLSNTVGPSGAGVGCGVYDEFGAVDGGGIARLMNDYAFGFCFNPSIEKDNALHFLDYCLSNLSNSFFADGDDQRYFASKAGLPGGLDPNAMGRYWSQHQEYIRQLVRRSEDRYVFAPGYTASYREDLAGVFAVLDELAKQASETDVEA